VVENSKGEQKVKFTVACAKHTERNRVRRKKHNEQAKIYNRKRRAENLAKGLCLCGRKLFKKRKRCKECLEKANIAAKIKRIRVTPTPVKGRIQQPDGIIRLAAIIGGGHVEPS
jgi:hypothetical protein